MCIDYFVGDEEDIGFRVFWGVGFRVLGLGISCVLGS